MQIVRDVIWMWFTDGRSNNFYRPRS